MMGSIAQPVQDNTSKPSTLQTGDAFERTTLAPDMSKGDIERLVTEMHRDGFAVIRDFLRPSDLRGLQAFVEGKIAANDGQYVALTGKAAVTGSTLEALADDGSFQSLLARLCAAATGKQPPAQSIYQVLRCLSGDTGVRQSMIFHFDSFVVTALVPIVIPTKGLEGHLIMKPNLRKERAFYLFNLADKIVVDNKITQWFLKRAQEKGWIRMERIVMAPGDLYLFWGYRSLHANEPCDTDAIRSTALFHYGDPHLKSPLRNFLGRQKV